MSVADELSRLEELRNNGTLTEVEFHEAKKKVLEQSPAQPREDNPYAAPSASSAQPGLVPGQTGLVHGMPEDTYCALLHLSQLLAFSGLGIIAPIVMWLMAKDDSELVRRHGAAVMNWMISALIYAIVSGILVLFIIGVPLLFLLGILQVVFPIVAAIKAKDGGFWSYPLTIKFFSEAPAYS